MISNGFKWEGQAIISFGDFLSISLGLSAFLSHVPTQPKCKPIFTRCARSIAAFFASADGSIEACHKLHHNKDCTQQCKQRNMTDGKEPIGGTKDGTLVVRGAPQGLHAQWHHNISQCLPTPYQRPKHAKAADDIGQHTARWHTEQATQGLSLGTERHESRKTANIPP